MPTDAGTDADAVRVEISTHLDDAAIEGDSNDPDDDEILGRVERDIDREYDDSDFEDTQHRKDFEAVLAALRIASGRDRRAESVQSGRTRTTYEASEVASLRARLRRLDPGDAFSVGGVKRNSDRNVGSVERDA